MYKNVTISKKDLFEFHIPHIWHPDYREDIATCLESIAMIAFYLFGDDQMGLEDMVENELGSTIENYMPEEKYQEYSDELDDLVNGYNFLIDEAYISEPKIALAIDEEKSSFLRSDEYFIYKIVLAD